MIQVTPKALGKIQQLLVRQNAPDGGLRLGVQGGGCSGYSYVVRIETAPRPKDQIFDFGGVKVFVDPKSLKLLQGLTLDYRESLMQSGFVFENPNAKKSCGCGTSFSV